MGEIKRKGKRNHIVYTITYFFFLRRRYTISVPYYILIYLHIYCYQNTRAYIKRSKMYIFVFYNNFCIFRVRGIFNLILKRQVKRNCKNIKKYFKKKKKKKNRALFVFSPKKKKKKKKKS